MQEIITNTERPGDTAEQSTDHILRERQGTHGNFSDGAKFVQAVMRAAMAAPMWAATTDVQRECIHHIAQKLQRIVCGDPNFRDHWIDISGYANIAANHLEKK